MTGVMPNQAHNAQNPRVALHQQRVSQFRVVAAKVTDRASVFTYKPFFLAGIASVLLAGCMLGAIALLGIALQGSYTASAWAPYVRAHANSQLFGWVGFFVMGFSLQQHAPRTGALMLYKVLAAFSIWGMAVGLALRFVAEPLFESSQSLGTALGLASTIVQAAAVTVFVSNIALTRHRSGEPMSWKVKFVFASLFFMLVAAFAEPWLFLGTHAADPQDRVMFIAQWMPVARAVQFLGFVSMMVFGVSLAKFDSCFGGSTTDARMGNAGFVLWVTGLAAHCAGWVSAFQNGFSDGRLYRAGNGLLLIGAVAIVIASYVFKPLTPAPSVKFVRMAYAWLLVAGLLMVFEPLHLSAIGAPFSHAYTGAVRHALTVGFISQMIVGVGAHVVYKMGMVPDSRQSWFVPTFVLLNLGNAARVGLEIATDFTASAFLPMGATGFVELVGIAIWGVTMAATMLRRPLPARAPTC